MAGLKYTWTLSEEIVRWAFEVYIGKTRPASENWWVAFSNPVAGPWKSVMALDDNNQRVEIHRFGQDDKRPDLILVSDSLKIILIVEAKDSLSKLVATQQMSKSMAVIVALTKTLEELEHPAWLKRKEYTVLPGFLWAATNPTKETRTLGKAYDQLDQSQDFPGYLAICVCKSNSGLTPVVLGRLKPEGSVDRILQSLGLELRKLR